MIPITMTAAFRLAPHLGLLGFVSLAGLTALAPAKAGMVENAILSKCAEAMVKDFQKAGKTPPAGMVNDTCNCVLTRWQQKLGLDTAIKTCSADATAKYGMSSAAPANSKGSRL